MSDELLHQISGQVLQVRDQITNLDEKMDRKLDAVEARVGDLEIFEAEVKTKARVWSRIGTGFIAVGTMVGGWLGLK